ncbi:MAG: DUF72 domain-containing protein [Bacteroidia bacterium]
MKFGHLENLVGVDFSLAPDPERNKSVLMGTDVPNAKLYIGSTHWIDKNFVGNIYPAKAKQSQFLYHYTRAFTTLELNATHYRVFEQKVVERWALQSQNNFVFCPKMYQLVSHRYRLKNSIELTQDVAESLSPLKKMLGPVFIQLPDNMNADSATQIEKYFTEVGHLLPFSLEVRHHSFLNDDFFNLLQKLGATTCITDVAGRRDLAHMHLTTPQVLIRFVGNALHKTDYERIDDWIHRLKYWFDNGLEKAFFFIHQPDALAVKPLYDYMKGKCNELGIKL